MDATTVAVDLAKTVFELAIANAQWRIVSRQRLNRARFARFLTEATPTHVVMEACGMAHYWGRRAQQAGHRVTLVPPADVRPYVRRNKTDRADAEAILEAVRSGELPSVPVKRIEQQALVSWLGLTPREHSSGARRRLGSISKRGDVYLRCLLSHGARAVLLAAQRRHRDAQPLTRLHVWALTVRDRRGHNKATMAVANKLGRIVWAVWQKDAPFAVPAAA